MSYPPPGHRIEVCAHCHKVRDNPSPLVLPRCCTSPMLYTYERVQGIYPRSYPPEPVPANPKQMVLPIAAPKIERCAWCDERHPAGPEHCADAQWQTPGGSL